MWDKLLLQKRHTELVESKIARKGVRLGTSVLDLGKGRALAPLKEHRRLVGCEGLNGGGGVEGKNSVRLAG